MSSLRLLLLRAALLAGSLCLAAEPLPAQFNPARDGIDYFNGEADDAVSRLQRRIDAGEVELRYDQRLGYLPAVLKHLEISPKTQALVFSKTSMQLRWIDPEHPRAIYFNDDVYVGYVQQGEVLEISTADPKLGALFYTLPQQPTDRPRFERDAGICLNCHGSARTQGVPGHLMRSLHVDSTGMPHFDAGTFTTNHASPFKDRFGGWYVTGTHGDARHMGNATMERHAVETYDREPAANLTRLDSLVDLRSYPTPHSDLVAQLVLAHQIDMHNAITRANYDVRRAITENEVINKALERPQDRLSDSIRRRIASAGDRVLRYMLMAEEAPLPAPVAGTSGFAEEFAAGGPRDSAGRSLRQLDLQQRLFKYRCSYLIYSEAFQSLPQPVLSYVYERLDRILTEDSAMTAEERETYAYLPSAERRAIHEILTATLPNFPPAQ